MIASIIFFSSESAVRALCNILWNIIFLKFYVFFKIFTLCALMLTITLKTYFLKALITLCNISIAAKWFFLLNVRHTPFFGAPFQSWIKLYVYIFFEFQILFKNWFASKILNILFWELFTALIRHKHNFYDFSIFNICLQMIFHTIYAKFVVLTFF